MKTMEQMTLTSASHRNENFAAWLSTTNSFLTELLGCTISNLAALGCVLFTLLFFSSILFALDTNAAYGWSAFCALAAINALLPLIREFKKGGE